MSKKNKPTAARSKFKETAAYKKPSGVGPNEKAGSSYREKLRARQNGNAQDPRSEAPIANPGPDMGSASQKSFGRASADVRPARESDILKTASFVGGGSREMELKSWHFRHQSLPAVTDPNLKFKPCFLVAEKVGGADDMNRDEWKITRYVGLSDPSGKFRGQVDSVTGHADKREVERLLGQWAATFGFKDASSQPNYMFRNATMVNAQRSNRPLSSRAFD